jgi:glycosyltransferase involved in cell wall biosynthesis
LPRERAKVSALVVHESPRHFEQPGRLTLNTALDAMRSYDYRVFVSDRGRAEWNALASLDPARSLYIPNCVREQHVAAVLARDRDALRAQYGYRADSLRLVCVGSVSPRKGQDLVIDALYRLSSSRSPVYVDFLGPMQDAWAQRMAARVGNSPLATRVRFLGTVDDVYERIYAADALLLASRAEASPLSVLEAMALGTCVIAADVDGVAELVLNGQTGSLFGREDVAALAACVSKLNEDPPLRAALGRAGRERYRSEFNRARQLERWTEALTRMLG